MIRNYRRRNPNLELPELWHRMKKQGYSRCLEKSVPRNEEAGATARKAEKTKAYVKFFQYLL